MADEGKTYDIIIIGGGVNGAGLARDCAKRGLSVCLIEKRDWCSGATAGCSGMIHGGVRYMLHDVDTTRLACIDSGYIQKIAPHLLFRIPFMYPVTKGMPAPKIALEFIETFFEAYDNFVPAKNGKPHTRLTADEARRLEPALTDRVVGAVTMDEWGIDPFRLTVANVVDAEKHGADVFNWTEVREILWEQKGDGKRKVTGVRCRDTRDRTEQFFYAETVFNAGGPWLSRIAEMADVPVKIRPSKGVHLVVDRRYSDIAIITTAIDGRQIFIIPQENTSIIGTTDDDYFGDIDELRVNDDEVEYLLAGIARVLPDVRSARIVRAFAALRPTLYDWGKYEDDLSRAYRIYDHGSEHDLVGFFTIAGGKLASYREMAEDAADRVCKYVGNETGCRTHIDPLPGGEDMETTTGLAEEFGWFLPLAERLRYRHGDVARTIMQQAVDDGRGEAVVCNCEPVSEAEIRYTIRHEGARSVADLRRRTRLGTGPCQGCRCTMRAAEILAEELGEAGDPQDVTALAQEFLQERFKGKAPILSHRQAAQEELSRGLHYASANLAGVLKDKDTTGAEGAN